MHLKISDLSTTYANGVEALKGVVPGAQSRIPITRRRMHRLWPALALVSGVSANLVGCQPTPAPTAMTRSVEHALAVPNDNRTPAGTLRDGVLELDLEARPVRWQGERSDLAPDAGDPTVVEVLGFAEAAGPVMIPGPLIRVPKAPKSGSGCETPYPKTTRSACRCRSSARMACVRSPTTCSSCGD